MALKKVTWFGVGDLRALGISKGRTRVVESQLLSSAVYHSYGRSMVVQDARTCVVEHIGERVSNSQVQKLGPRGYAKNLTEPDLTILKPAQPISEPIEEAPSLTLGPAPTEVSDPVEQIVEPTAEEVKEFGAVEALDEAPDEPLFGSAEAIEPEQVASEEAPEVADPVIDITVSWELMRVRLMAQSKAALKTLAEYYDLDATGTKTKLADRFEAIKDEVDITLLD
jgi:hypothetical protein